MCAVPPFQRYPVLPRPCPRTSLRAEPTGEPTHVRSAARPLSVRLLEPWSPGPVLGYTRPLPPG